MTMRASVTIAFALFAVLSPSPAQSQEEGCRQRLPTDRTTIDLRGADVQTTLRLLAERYRVSLIITPEATGVVTMSLYEVPVREVFDALARGAGLACTVRDGILVVTAREQARKEQEELTKVEQARSAGEAEARKKQAEARREDLALAELQARGPLREESIRLAYADPEDVARTLQGMLGFAVGAAPPPGAPGGPPLIPAPPFSVLYGTAPPPPVAPRPMPPAGGIAATPDALTNLNNPNLTLGSFLPVSAASGLPLGGNIVNFPVSPSGTFGGITPAGIAFGLIGGKFNINLVLDALEAQSKTTSLAKPEVVTTENAKALISLGSEIPYSTVSSAGTQVQFKDALLKLEVTPTVIRELGDITSVKMVVNVENNSLGGLVPQTGGGFVPSINRRSATTQVVVKEGETLAIGGIRQQDVVESIQKVPFFGDIPILGWLFKSKSRTTDPNRELVIFITPTILPTQRPR